MNRILKQLKYTSNLSTIDRLLRITIDESVAKKNLQNLSLATKYHLLDKGSYEIKQFVLLDITKKCIPQDLTLSQLFSKVFQYIINFGIKSQEPTNQPNLNEFLTLSQKINIYNKIQHIYFNDNIKEDLLNYIEENKPLNCRISSLLKWLHLQDQKTYQEYLPIIINIVLYQKKLNYRSHKYINFQYERIQKSELENVKLFLTLYQNILLKFMNTSNKKKQNILLKIELKNKTNLQYNTNLIEQEAKKFNNLDNIQNIKFYLQYSLDLEWLLIQIINKNTKNHIYKTEIVNLINHILKLQPQLIDQFQLELFEQIVNAFEPEEVFYKEFLNIFDFLLIIKDYSQKIVVQLLRMFADKHILFDVDEFTNIILQISKFGEVNIEDESQSYKASIYDETRDYYIEHALQLNKDVHKLFISNQAKKL